MPTAITRQGDIMEFLKKLLSEDTLKELNTLLGEELVNQINEKTGNFAIDVAKEKFIPKDRFDSEREEIKSLKEQITERDNQLNELSTKVKGNADLELKIKELQEANANAQTEYAEKLKETSQNYAFKEALHKFTPRNLKALEALIDKSTITYEADDAGSIKGVKGLDEQIEALKKSDSYLFEQAQSGTGTPQNSTNFDNKNEDAFVAGFKQG